MRDGAEADFAEFFSATWPRLFRTLHALTGDVGRAEDALQSAFAKAYASWHRVRSADFPEAYLRRMAVHEVLGVRRRAWWKAEQLGPLPEHTGRHGHPDRAVHASPEDDLLDRDEVWQSLMALAPRQRAVLVLRYYEDLSEQQIADVLGCSRGTVKSQSSDALSALRRRHTAAALVERDPS